jgi:hypothetical protein
MKKTFNQVKVVCPSCGEAISSSHPGEFVQCGCYSETSGIYVDQTEYYCRIGGPDSGKIK